MEFQGIGLLLSVSSSAIRVHGVKLNKTLNMFNIKLWLHGEGKWCLRFWELLHSWTYFTFCGKERRGN